MISGRQSPLLDFGSRIQRLDIKYPEHFVMAMTFSKVGDVCDRTRLIRIPSSCEPLGRLRRPVLVTHAARIGREVAALSELVTRHDQT